MIIYKVSQNYQKGIQEFEVESVNDNSTFNYLNPFNKKMMVKPPIDGFTEEEIRDIEIPTPHKIWIKK